MNTEPQASFHSLVLKTREGVSFSIPLAGVATRLFAALIDQAVISVILIAVGAVTALLGLISTDMVGALLLLAHFLCTTGYSILLEWLWNGQTVGKRVLKIQVMDDGGMKVSFPQIAIRNLMKVVDMLPVFFALGGISFFLSKLNKRLGDIAANTVVVNISIPEIPDYGNVAAEKFNSLQTQKHMAAQLRYKGNNKIAYLALDALMRRDDFNPEGRLQVFGEIAAYYRNLVDFSEDAQRTLSDEILVRNIVEIIFKAPDTKPVKQIF
ncbi:MAG: RDD family protein [Fibrobacteria bacterium]|nr:RDD family protein [Fibrobacteria bacterium]